MSRNYLIRKGVKKSLSIILILVLLMGGLGITGLAPADIYAADPEGDIAETVANIIDATKSITGSPINPDWVLSMKAKELEIPPEKLEIFLKETRQKLVRFMVGVESAGTMAKYAMALTSLGIDARHIPDGIGNPVDLIRLIAESVEASGMSVAYDAPYVLMLFGLGIYELDNYDDAKFSIDDLLQYIISEQGNETSLWSDWSGQPTGIDETGMILPSLVKHYESDPAVKTAVDKAIQALSDKQGEDGGFNGGWGSNSSTAEVIISGLIPLGINPHSDVRFKKNDISIIDHLLTYKTAENTLGYNDNSEIDEWSSIYGFQALVQYENQVKNENQVEKTERTNIYDVDEEVHVYTSWPDAELLTSISVTKKPTKTTYDLDLGGSTTPVITDGIEVKAFYNGSTTNTKNIETGYTISTIDASTPGTKSVTVTYQGQTATFNVSVKESGGAMPSAKTVKLTVKSSGKGTIASDNSYVIEAGKTTVLDVLKAVLSEAGKGYVVAGGYVSEIDGLSEFSQGANSGWKYYVNGTDPDYTAASHKLYGGEVIEWRFTLDFTKEAGAEKWNNTPLPGATGGTIDKKMIEEALKDILSGAKESFTINLAKGAVSFDKESLEGLADQIKGGSFEVKIEEVLDNKLSGKQKKAAGNRPVYDINIIADKKNISTFKGKLTFSIPYSLKVGEKPTGIVVYHLNDAGELIPMAGHYDSATGRVIFHVDHLSYYVIGYDEALVKWPFVDVAQDDSINWFYSPVKFVCEKGIFAGTSETTFSPNLNLTRSMVAAVLARHAGADLSTNRLHPFNDVNKDSWYGPSVAWAKEAGIINGYKNHDGSYSFRPDATISRQDLAVMIDNYNRIVAKTIFKKAGDREFTDSKNIADYAKASVASMQQAGIINGTKNPDGTYRFNPKGHTTRAEAATMIYNMLKPIGEQ